MPNERYRKVLWVVCIFIAITTPKQVNAFQQDANDTKEKKTEDVSDQEITKLIQELNSPKFQVREAAQQKLTKLGRPAMKALIEIDLKRATPQTVFRVNKIVAAIKENSAGYIDLSKKSNQKLKEKLGRFEGNTLETLPDGVQKLGGVNFKIGASGIVLSGGNLPNRPSQVKGIKVSKKCDHLHFLQAMQFGTGIKDGEQIGKYVVHYDDGKQEEIPIVFGEDVRDWWNVDSSKAVKRGKIAWTGNNRATKSADYSLRLYVSSWKNPHPEKTVSHIDFVQTHSVAAPFCVAMTAESDTGAKK